MYSISELNFLIRSWLNVIVLWQAVMRRRSASWMFEALGVLASVILAILAIFGILAYWLINKWGGE